MNIPESRLADKTEVVWYRQAWPWFIIAIPGTAVVMGIITLYLAFSYRDPLVRDDWYQAGKAINQELKRDHLASSLNLKAQISFDHLSGEVLVTLNRLQPQTTSLTLSLVHPTLPQRDVIVSVHKIPGMGRRYRGDLSQDVSGRRRVILEPVKPPADNQWRLHANNVFIQDNFVLGAP